MKATNKIIKTLAEAVLSLLVPLLPRSLKLQFHLSILVLFAGLAAVPVASAAPNTGGGRIYYVGPWAPGPTAATTTMNSDGSGKTLVVIEGGYVGVWGIPSRALHNNHRWFVRSRRITGQYYPNGIQRSEVFAMRDDTLTAVQLTDVLTLESDGRVDWVPGDERVSFKARRWSSAEPGATVVEAGLYTASLAFDGAGNITGLAAQPTTPAIPFSLVETVPGELWLANMLNAHTRIYMGYEQAPQWSPDGTKIAFTHGGIATIRPNGTGFKLIIPGTSTWIYNAAQWSPASTHIVYTGYSNLSGNFDLFRATATGGSRVNLTDTLSGDEHSYGGWR
ncbi:MAG: hypothetical protein EXS36_15275 [Pedosphaera sp.]|nr:hypothetical protein [Pedosphaera sp.]